MNAPHRPAPQALAEASLMTEDEYYPSLMPLKRADRRFLSLVNGDTSPTIPACFPAFSRAFRESIRASTSCRTATTPSLYHIMTGKGYSVLEGERIDWAQGDTFVCPPWTYREDFNDGTEVAIQYVIQDLVARAYERNLMWEEPKGHFGHMVQGGFRPHNPEYDK